MNIRKGQADIDVCDLTVEYNTRHGSLRALEHVTFSVERGTICCIVGPSGCGKSTLLRAILGLIENKAGSATISGSATINEERRSSKDGHKCSGIAFVQQDCPMLPWRTALQNACLGAEIRGENNPHIGEINQDIVDRVRRQLSDFGLGGFEDNLTVELSGGMRQQVAITRAIESHPAVLFCDEPFSAVDFVGRLALTTKFKNLCRVRGITTVFVTHNIEEAIFLGNLVLVMTGRPGQIKKVCQPEFSVGSDNAVRCREAPEFAALFQSIWQELEDNDG